MLMDKIDKLNETFKNEVNAYKKETMGLRSELSDRQAQIKHLEKQIDQLTQCAQLEFPIVINRSGQ